MLSIQRQSHGRFEEITVGGNGKRTALKCKQALCDRKTESAALRIAGGIAAHEALQKFLAGFAEGRFGDIFEMDGAETVLRRGFQINARAGKGIFADVSEQIIKNAPKQIAVCHERMGG